MKKPISAEVVRGRLFQGGFSRPAADLPQPSDPETRIQMELTLDQIKPYDRNPRRAPNPKYAEIKEQIRAARGLDNYFTVTRRPGEELYMVEAGGNTRLKILRELYNETGDAVFYRHVLFFVPWVNESTALRKHIVENTLRGEMSFIDQAMAFFELRRDWERERGEPIGDRQFIALLEEQGLKEVSRSQFHRMKYAIEALLHVLPTALEAGLGSSHVAQINKHETQYKTYWKSKDRTDEEAFSVLFRGALAALDEPEFAVETVPDAVESQLAKHLNIPLSQVRQELDLMRSRAMAGKLPDLPTTNVSNPNPFRATSAAAKVDPNTPEPSQGARPRAPTINDQAPASPGTPMGVFSPPIPPPVEAAGNVATGSVADIATLRQHAFNVADAFARDNGLAGCVRSVPIGYGFTVDFPSVKLDSHTQDHVWWLLLSASEQLSEPERLPLLPADNHLVRLVASNQENEVVAMRELTRIMGACPAVDGLHYLFLNDISSDLCERNFRAFFTLTETCRRLLKCSLSAGVGLWEGT